MDKELDDLLDSALDDFDKKVTIKDEEPLNVKQLSNNVTIEHTNLYVDDIDYDDRPSNTASSATPKSTLKTSNDPSSGFTLDDENLKIFEGIFNNNKNDQSVKDFKGMFDMFQNSKDETNLLDNFQKVMSELINEENNLDEDLSDFDNIEVR